MSAKTGRITSFLQQAPLPVFTAFAIAASFSTYFCMYAFRKPFVAASFLGADGDPIKFWSSAVDLKSALVISQILGYTLSKYIGIKICSEVTRARRATMLIAMILLALAALILYGVLPDQWKFVGIFLGGLPLGMVWGLVVWYLEGRTVSEVLLAGLSCSFIVASGVVRDVGRHLMGDWGVTEGWMPALTGGLFLIPFFISVWLLNQLPRPTERDELARTHREPMRGSDRVAFVRSFFWGLLMLAVAYFFLTAYREYRDIYQGEMFAALEYPYDAHKTIITKAETLVAFGVLIPLGLLFLIRNNRWGLIGTYSIMVCGLVILGGSTWALENNQIGSGMVFALEQHHQVLEGGGAVGIAAVLAKKVSHLGKYVVIIASGGNVSLPVLLDLAQRQSS